MTTISQISKTDERFRSRRTSNAVAGSESSTATTILEAGKRRPRSLIVKSESGSQAIIQVIATAEHKAAAVVTPITTKSGVAFSRSSSVPCQEYAMMANGNTACHATYSHAVS